MAKVEMSIEQILNFALFGMQNGRYEAAEALLRDLLKAIRTDPRYEPLREPQPEKETQP